MTIRLLIILCFLANLTNLHGQIIADSILYKLPLVNNPEVKVLRTSLETTFEEIKQQTIWKPYDSTYITPTETALWLKFEMENRSKDTVYSYFSSGDHYTAVYQQRGDDFEISKNGFYVPLPQHTNPSKDYFTKLTFDPFQNSLIYVRLNANKVLLPSSFSSVFSERGYWKESQNILDEQTNSIGVIYFYIISLITIFIFALVFWMRLREKLYLYYLGYLFFQLVYGFIVLHNTLAPIGNFFNNIPKLSNNLFEPVQFMFIGFYVFFITYLLRVKSYDVLLSRILYYLGIGCFVYAITRFGVSYFFYEPQLGEILFAIVRLIILPLNFILIFWIIYKVKHPLLPYFIIGQSFFFIGALLASYAGYTGVQYIPGHFLSFKEAPNIVFQIGLLLEVYCFSLALGKNIFLLRKEKEKIDTELIDQLRENQLLQGKMNRELDKKVNEKTKELIQLYSELEKEKEQKIKDDFTKKLRETEMVALRSQMNPHFIFNSLNAIKHSIMSSRNEDAVAYLDDFSSLLRGILNNSNRKKITVEEELEILEFYLSLEHDRLGKELNYEIQVSCKEELSQYQIPPLLLQPFVENAIWHGLHPSLKTEKKLLIIFDTSDTLKITIEDNGIGRKESDKKEKSHNAMGTDIIRDRLALYNHLNDHSIQLYITDLEADGVALGTKITLIYQN